MSKMSMSEIYSEPEAYGLPRKGITLNNKEAALVVVDPQIDFLSPQGIGWEVFKNSIIENIAISSEHGHI
ncbi:MAG: cysteine hydrolase, partial [Gammaproteobacteria bacterium]|nr:cysteine hydrolase [Gammaproteobacteria bacterium]